MTTFLTVTLGVLAALILFAALVYWWIKRKLKSFGRALGDLAGVLPGGVPPFRISLESEEELRFKARDDAERIGEALTGLGYEASGDFTVPQMPGVKLRGFCNRVHASMAALYEHPEAGLMLDLVRVHKDRHQVLVTNAPHPGLEEPPNKHAVRFAAEIDPIGFHRTLLSESGGRDPLALTPRLFPLMFTTAYAAEMDWRIARGGVTADEVRGAALAGGQDEPDDSAIEMVQAQWRAAISAFVDEEIIKGFLESGQVTAARWEAERDRVCAVHEATDIEELIDDLASRAAQHEEDAVGEDGQFGYDEAHERVAAALRAAIGGRALSPDVLAPALELLPAEVRPVFLGSVAKPWPGHLYLMPDVDV